jgi:galactokinase
LDTAAAAVPRDDLRAVLRTVAADGSAAYPDAVADLHSLEPVAAEQGTTAALIRGIAAGFAARGYTVGGFSAVSDSRVPGGSGLSSSAAVEALIARIFANLYPRASAPPRENLSAIDLAVIGQYAENRFFGKPCGLMDQIACSLGGAETIDFADPAAPLVEAIAFDPAACGLALCVVNTGGSHADLSADYAAIPADMKAVAAFFGKEVLRDCSKAAVLEAAAEIRRGCGDRAFLRALHFFDENERVAAMARALKGGDSAGYLALVQESGDSSERLLQNVSVASVPREQPVAAALALTRDYIRSRGCKAAASRVHGGGFAGTIQVYVPKEELPAYTGAIEAVFGEGSLTELVIRQEGAVEL